MYCGALKKEREKNIYLSVGLAVYSVNSNGAGGSGSGSSTSGFGPPAMTTSRRS